jgi:hypothetical protein
METITSLTAHIARLETRIDLLLRAQRAITDGALEHIGACKREKERLNKLYDIVAEIPSSKDINIVPSNPEEQ